MSGLPIIPTSDSRRQSKTARRQDGFRVRDHPRVIARWLESRIKRPSTATSTGSEKLVQRLVSRQVTFRSRHNGERKNPDHGRLLWKIRVD